MNGNDSSYRRLICTNCGYSAHVKKEYVTTEALRDEELVPIPPGWSLLWPLRTLVCPTCVQEGTK